MTQYAIAQTIIIGIAICISGATGGIIWMYQNGKKHFITMALKIMGIMAGCFFAYACLIAIMPWIILGLQILFLAMCSLFIAMCSLPGELHKILGRPVSIGGLMFILWLYHRFNAIPSK